MLVNSSVLRTPVQAYTELGAVCYHKPLPCATRRCDFCDGELKCELEGGTIRSEKIECEWDADGIDNDIEFECPITNGVADCDWTQINNRLPGGKRRGGKLRRMEVCVLR